MICTYPYQQCAIPTMFYSKVDITIEKDFLYSLRTVSNCTKYAKL